MKMRKTRCCCWRLEGGVGLETAKLRLLALDLTCCQASANPDQVLRRDAGQLVEEVVPELPMALVGHAPSYPHMFLEQRPSAHALVLVLEAP